MSPTRLDDKTPLCLAYYCSGHGYGHATRVSAFTRYLLTIHDKVLLKPIVYIVSSAPERVFADSIVLGARYRCADIDPVIVQPLAYRVDRQKSLAVLKKFLDEKDELLERERTWLLEVRAHCVLSDAAFLGCLAATAAGLPSLLITNFTFDSVYSYLSSHILETPSFPHNVAPASILDMISDIPISHDELAPLVHQIHAGYRCADLLVRLPGHIPIPSFFAEPALPSVDWIDVKTRRMKHDIRERLILPLIEQDILPSTGFNAQRSVIQAPLLVRPHSSGICTPDGRARLLASVGVPSHLQHSLDTKILIVSFGGQVFRRPNSSRGSCIQSRRSSRQSFLPISSIKQVSPSNRPRKQDEVLKPLVTNSNAHSNSLDTFKSRIHEPLDISLHIPSSNFDKDDSPPCTSTRLTTPGHIWIPGAPPASTIPMTLSNSFSNSSIPIVVSAVPPTPTDEDDFDVDVIDESQGLDAPWLLPDSSWIAIVCGVSKEQWNMQQNGEVGNDNELPEGFYVAPGDIYMPDLTAIGDVLLGKLGYGTVSECVDACTPFVYVSRPLFIEEHGLRLLLDQEGVGVELSRQSYEAGDWAAAVSEAWTKGLNAKNRKKYDMQNSIGIDKRQQEGKELAGSVMNWIRAWWEDDLRKTVLS